jgi:DNA-binding protein HU-beta
MKFSDVKKEIRRRIDDERLDQLRPVTVTAAQVDAVMRIFCDIVTEEMRGDESVAVPQFGTFLSGYRQEKVGVNPKTGEKMVVPARRAPKFKAAKALKAAVNPA